MRKLEAFKNNGKKLNLTKIKGGDALPELSLAQKSFSSSSRNELVPELTLAQK